MIDIGPPPLIFPKPAIIRAATPDLLVGPEALEKASFLPGMFPAGALAARSKYADMNLLEIVTDLGLNSTLDMCFDAAAAASYDGSSQTWTSLSGSNAFYRGSGSGSEGSDPTFNGTAGGLSRNEYFSTDGGDIFTRTTANSTAINNWHKDNATHTFLAIVYWANANSQTLMATSGAPDSTRGAIWIGRNGAGQHQYSIRQSGAVYNTTFGSQNIPTGQWVLQFVSMDEPNSSCIGGYNSTSFTFSGAYGPSNTNNGFVPLRIWQRGDGGETAASGSRIAGLMTWTTNLSLANIQTLIAAIQAGRGY